MEEQELSTNAVPVSRSSSSHRTSQITDPPRTMALSILQLELNNARSRRVNPFTHPAGYVGDLSLSRGSFQLFPIPRVTPTFFSLNHGFLAGKTAGKLPRGHLFCTQQCVHYDSTTIGPRDGLPAPLELQPYGAI